jgi:transcriptional regulator with XRE-family HTH domain
MSSPLPRASIDFAARLRACREKYGLSQTALAERARLTPSAVSHFESGRRQPSLANLERIVAAMPGSAGALLGSDEPLPGVLGDFNKLWPDDQKLVRELMRGLARRY